ncbi:MAG: sulfatase-like hydrolase/transferase, partial [Thermoanaerobaculia bacterium]|nr:sulfatase-like hydrolase/transferase [Thermoanaerobaculia bacterium]
MAMIRMLYGWFCRLVLGLVAAVLLFVLFVVVRIVTWHQTDDPARLETKRDYLERVAATTLPPSAPNLVVILFDDLGYGDLGAYGSEAVRTPHLDRLAAEGIRFDSGYAASPYCSASRVGLLTGRYPVRAGLDHVLQAPGTWEDLLLELGWKHRWLPGEEILLSEVLSAAGYRSAIYGKW